MIRHTILHITSGMLCGSKKDGIARDAYVPARNAYRAMPWL